MKKHNLVRWMSKTPPKLKEKANLEEKQECKSVFVVPEAANSPKIILWYGVCLLKTLLPLLFSLWTYSSQKTL